MKIEAVELPYPASKIAEEVGLSEETFKVAVMALGIGVLIEETGKTSPKLKDIAKAFKELCEET